MNWRQCHVIIFTIKQQGLIYSKKEKEQHLQLKKEIKPAKSIYRPVRIVFKSLSFLVKVMLNILTNEIGFLDFILQENTVPNCVDK